jgi:AAA+ ATPase superfamily predicted ATPase
LREYNVYLDILHAINDGRTKISEIASISGVDVTNISKYLKVLVGMKILEKTRPVTANFKEKSFRYMLKDNYFRFWLRYVYPYKNNIETDPKPHIHSIISGYASYLGRIFEDFCKRIIIEKKLLGYTNISSWWFKDKELDIVGIDDDRKMMLIGECKWQEGVVPQSLLSSIASISELVLWNNTSRTIEYALFAKSFKKKIKSYNGYNVYCYDLKDLEKILKTAKNVSE